MKDVIAFDIGGTNIRAASVVVSSSGLGFSKRLKGPTGPNPLEVINDFLERLLKDKKEAEPIIGVSVAGVVDSNEGVLLKSPNIPKLEGVNFKKLIRDRYGKGCVIENDANAATYGEKVAGAGMNFDNFVMFTLGTGIGGGVVLNGRLLSIPAEIGHMSINMDGPQCPCGNVGCLETMASATALIGRAVSEIERGANTLLKSAHNGNFYKINAEDIYNTALDGDVLARSLLKDAGKALGIGIANIVNMFGPEAVILTGGLTGAWNIYVDSAIKEASRRSLKELFSKVKIIPSALKDDAGITGVAYIAAGF